MPKPTFYYKSSAMPVGSRKVTFYRPTNPQTPGGPGGGGDTNLGIYLLENCSPHSPGKLIERNGIYGEPLDISGVEARKTMSAKAQSSTDTTPTLQKGDYFEDTFDVTATGAATANERYFITEATNTETAGEARSQSINLSLDYDNSARWA